MCKNQKCIFVENKPPKHNEDGEKEGGKEGRRERENSSSFPSHPTTITLLKLTQAVNSGAL